MQMQMQNANVATNANANADANDNVNANAHAKCKMQYAICLMQHASLICKQFTLVGVLSVVTLSLIFTQVQVKYGTNCLQQNLRIEFI